MKRLAILVFGVAVYAVFFATFLYLIAFVGNLQVGLAPWFPQLAGLVPRSIDLGGAQASTGAAIAIDLALILAFGLQHSVMARTGFKAWLKRHLDPSAERSVYVLLASLVLVLLFWQWRPIPAIAWSFASPAGQALAWGVYGLGFGVVLLSTFLIDHFDLFGIKQVVRQFFGREAVPARFVTPLLYRFVRHPLYLGFVLAFWGGAVMSAGHLLFAAAMTAYILIAIQLEERDLVRQLGDRYVQYRGRVPMLVPGLGGRGRQGARAPGRELHPDVIDG
jgi:protein-S-isoprenylcysteine O-methyltransferase Ste14